MITKKINDLFQFIDFLNSNIEKFKKYENLTIQLQGLGLERSNLNPKNNYYDKLRFDEIQIQIEQKFKELNINVIQPIYEKAKILELGIFDNKGFWNWKLSEIHVLKDNFSVEDIPLIRNNKEKYIEYRKSTKCNYFQTFFFKDLDEELKEFFEFFNDSNKNEFESFESAKIQVDNIDELIKVLVKKQDTRFWITIFADHKQSTIPEYRSYKNQIENNGYFSLIVGSDNVKIYTPELAILLSSKSIKGVNLNTQQEVEIKCFDYLKTYIDGFKDGEKYFEKDFSVTPNILYGTNAEQYIRDLHANYYHINQTGAQVGWSYVKKQVPIIITHKIIKDFGFYSGIVNKVDTMVKKYPLQFQSFDICEYNIQLEPQQPDTNEPIDEVFKFENNFDRVQCSIVYKYFKDELVNKKYLNEENFHAFLKIAFENSLQLQSKFKFEKKYIIKDIRAIFYKYYNEINFEKYKNQDKYIKLLTDYFEGFEFDKVKSNFNK